MPGITGVERGSNNFELLKNAIKDKKVVKVSYSVPRRSSKEDMPSGKFSFTHAIGGNGKINFIIKGENQGVVEKFEFSSSTNGWNFDTHGQSVILTFPRIVQTPEQYLRIYQIIFK